MGLEYVSNPFPHSLIYDVPTTLGQAAISYCIADNQPQFTLQG